MRLEQQRLNQPPATTAAASTARTRWPASAPPAMPAVLRLRMPDGTTEWDDVIRGSVTYVNADIDDQVLLKSDGFPTYHLAVVVDDHLMGRSPTSSAPTSGSPRRPSTSPSTPPSGWDPPPFCHVPQVLGPDRQKLSKRRGARTVLEYAEMGYLPEALVNAMALLGWSSGTEQEVFSREELDRRILPRPGAAVARDLRPPPTRLPQRPPHPAHGARDAGRRRWSSICRGTSEEERRRLLPCSASGWSRCATRTSGGPAARSRALGAGRGLPAQKMDVATAGRSWRRCRRGGGGRADGHRGLRLHLTALTGRPAGSRRATVSACSTSPSSAARRRSRLRRNGVHRRGGVSNACWTPWANWSGGASPKSQTRRRAAIPCGWDRCARR